MPLASPLGAPTAIPQPLYGQPLGANASAGSIYQPPAGFPAAGNVASPVQGGMGL
jgi:hypothetical protein